MQTRASRTRTHSYDPPQLTGPDLTYSLVKHVHSPLSSSMYSTSNPRPLVDKYHSFQRKGNKAVVFCLLLNRAHFLRDSGTSTAYVPTSLHAFTHRGRTA